jgi:FG-GAP-like repeat
MLAPKKVTAVLLVLVVTAFGGAQAPPFKILDSSIPQTAIWATAIGDLDGDGDADLLDTMSPAPMLYRNDGHGRFTGVAVSSLLSSLSHTGFRAVLADFDGNGLLDVLSIVLVNFGGQALFLHLNTGALTFTNSPPLPVLPSAFAGNVAVADSSAGLRTGKRSMPRP